MRRFGYALLAMSVAVSMPIPAAAVVAPGSAPDTATGLTGAYADNAFAKILDGRLPATKVYEDGQVLAFMNIHPLSTGDLLVIPKGRYRNLIDIPPDVLAHLMRVVQRLAEAQTAALHPDGIFIRQNSGIAADQTVFHFHVHVTPVYQGVAFNPVGYTLPPAPPAELAKVAARIAAELPPEGR